MARNPNYDPKFLRIAIFNFSRVRSERWSVPTSVSPANLIRNGQPALAVVWSQNSGFQISTPTFLQPEGARTWCSKLTTFPEPYPPAESGFYLPGCGSYSRSKFETANVYTASGCCRIDFRSVPEGVGVRVKSPFDRTSV